METLFLKSCDVLLYKGHGFNSWLIQFGTGSRYSHVAVVVNPEMHLAIESNVGHQAGVRALDLRKLLQADVDVFRVKPEFKFDPEKVISYLVAHLGASFDWPGVIWLGVLKAVSLLTGMTFKPFNQFQIAKDYFCSELCYEAFMSAGLDIVPNIGLAEVTSPGDIARSERMTQIVPLV